MKSLLLDNRLQSTVAVFYIQQDNLGQPDGEVDDPGVPGKENSQAYYEAEGVRSKGYEVEIVGGVNWQGSNYTDTTHPFTGEPERLRQEAYSLVSLMARYDVTNNLSAQLNLENVLDEEYYSQIGFYRQLEYGEPRDVTLSVRYKF